MLSMALSGIRRTTLKIPRPSAKRLISMVNAVILLTYKLIRYQMIKMAFSLKGDYLPYQLSYARKVREKRSKYPLKNNAGHLK